MKLFIAILLITFHNLAQAEPEQDLRVELHFLCPSKLSDDAQQQLSSEALALLKTSNLNTAAHNDVLQAETPDIQSRYRRVVGDKFLLISFRSARDVKTVGGKVRIQEIVIGLAGPAGGPVFTIDPESRIVQHVKFDDARFDQLLKLTQKFTDLK